MPGRLLSVSCRTRLSEIYGDFLRYRGRVLKIRLVVCLAAARSEGRGTINLWFCGRQLLGVPTFAVPLILTGEDYLQLDGVGEHSPLSNIRPLRQALE